MRTGRSGAQVQSGEAQMRHGTGHRKAAGDRCPCNCHVRFSAESPQDSVRPFEAIHLSGGCFLTEEKMDHCSVSMN